MRNPFLTTVMTLVLLLFSLPVFAVTPDKLSLEKIVQEKIVEKPAIIQVGSQGDDVRLVQKLLADFGFYSGEVDGVFGNGTKQAVQDFQSV